jgi:hypothetical protein
MTFYNRRPYTTRLDVRVPREISDLEMRGTIGSGLFCQRWPWCPEMRA